MSNGTVARVLANTMANAGWVDDSLELLGDVFDHLGLEGLNSEVEDVRTAIAFIVDNHPDEDVQWDFARLSETILRQVEELTS